MIEYPMTIYLLQLFEIHPALKALPTFFFFFESVSNLMMQMFLKKVSYGWIGFHGNLYIFP
jgi:hypothetical protein